MTSLRRATVDGVGAGVVLSGTGYTTREVWLFTAGNRAVESVTLAFHEDINGYDALITAPPLFNASGGALVRCSRSSVGAASPLRRDIW